MQAAINAHAAAVPDAASSTCCVATELICHACAITLECHLRAVGHSSWPIQACTETWQAASYMQAHFKDWKKHRCCCYFCAYSMRPDVAAAAALLLQLQGECAGL
jgi:hypothetical protein